MLKDAKKQTRALAGRKEMRTFAALKNLYAQNKQE